MNTRNPRTNKRWLGKRALAQGYKEQAAWIDSARAGHVVELELIGNGGSDGRTESYRVQHATNGVTFSEFFALNQLNRARAHFAEEAKR